MALVVSLIKVYNLKSCVSLILSLRFGGFVRLKSDIFDCRLSRDDAFVSFSLYFFLVRCRAAKIKILFPMKVF